jgi:hypothetical protein
VAAAVPTPPCIVLILLFIILILLFIILLLLPPLQASLVEDLALRLGATVSVAGGKMKVEWPAA